MHVLIVGGSYGQPGGLESFSEQSARALGRHDGSWTFHWIPSESAFLTICRLPIFARQLAKLVAYRARKPDLVWLQYVNLPDLLLLVVARLVGMRVMVTPHLGSNWRSQKSGSMRRVSRFLLGFSDRLALISPTQEREIALPRETPRSLVRNFLPEYVLAGTPLPPDRRGRTLRLLHSARLSEDKGSFLVVEVAARLRDAGMAFEADITGGADAETYARLDALIRRHDLAGVVKVRGRVTEAELVSYMQRADILLHLSRIDSYPLVLLEAMAFGALPVAMELAGARDMIETYDGLVVGTGDPVEEAAAWLIAADLTDLRRRGAEQAANVRRDYAWPRCAAALDAALRATIAGDRGAYTQPARVMPREGAL